MTKTLGIVVAAALALASWAPSASAREARPDCEAAAAAAKAEIDAACPCDGPSAHGDHVRCVTKKLRELSACASAEDGKRTCGPVPKQCAAKIRRIAARSTCGKPAAMVTCCVPKQRDCAGDNTPGDGKKDGTCTGSKRQCDSVTECMIPRCEAAASTERCEVIGGTVGRGRDCATACEQ